MGSCPSGGVVLAGSNCSPRACGPGGAIDGLYFRLSGGELCPVGSFARTKVYINMHSSRRPDVPY